MRTQRIIIDHRIDLYKRDFMELHAGPSTQSVDAAALRVFAEKASNTVDLAQEVFDSLEGIVRHYDNDEDLLAPAITTRNALIKAEGRMINAQ